MIDRARRSQRGGIGTPRRWVCRWRKDLEKQETCRKERLGCRDEGQQIGWTQQGQEGRHGGEERQKAQGPQGDVTFQTRWEQPSGKLIVPSKDKTDWLGQCFILPQLCFTEKVTIYYSRTLSFFTSLHRSTCLSPNSGSETSTSATDLQQ